MYEELLATFNPLSESPEDLLEGPHDAHVELIKKIEMEIRRKLRPSEFETSTRPTKAMGDEGMVRYSLSPRDYSLDNGGDNDPKVWKQKIKPGVAEILSKFKDELSKLGIDAQLVPSEKGWYPIEFEWKGEEDTSIDNEKLTELAKQIEKYTKPAIERRGWKWVGVYRVPKIEPGYGSSLSIYAVVTGVTDDSLSDENKADMKKWNHYDKDGVVWDAMMSAGLVGPSLGSRKRFGDDTDLMKGYTLRPKVVDSGEPKNLVKVL